MITDNKNFTRYETEDINALVHAVGSVRAQYTYQDYRNNTISGIYTPNVSNITTVRYIGMTELEKAQQRNRWRNRRSHVGKYAIVTGTGLKILNPNELSKFDELAYFTLANVENPVLPAPVLQEVVELIVTYSLRTRYSGVVPDTVKQQVCNEVLADASIRINPKPSNPGAKRVKLTKEEKIERLQSDSFYGEGGVLEGPDWAWSSGGRAPTRKWTSRIHEAMQYYEREKNARERHAEALRALGVEPKPYQSFSDFLRDYAAELDNRGGKR